MTAAQRPQAADPRPEPGAHATPARPAPATAPRTRPPLRVVGPRELGPRARRRRARLLTTGAGVLVSALLFGLVAFHVLIAQSQLQLGRMETQTSDAQARYDRLRLQVAQLSSPGRIVAAAQERLGMVAPPGVTFLSPVGPAAIKPPAPVTSAPKPAPVSKPAPVATTPTTASRSTPTTAAPRSTTPTTTKQTTSTTSAPRNRTKP